MNTDKCIAAITNWIVLKVPKILLAVIIMILCQSLIRVLKKWYYSWTKSRKIDPTLQPFLSGILFTIPQGLLILAVIQVMGIRMTIFATVIGAMVLLQDWHSQALCRISPVEC